jgi:hypothetical protein
MEKRNQENQLEKKKGKKTMRQYKKNPAEPT